MLEGFSGFGGFEYSGSRASKLNGQSFQSGGFCEAAFRTAQVRLQERPADIV